MKRRATPAPADGTSCNSAPLKKKTSILFSISTIHEDGSHFSGGDDERDTSPSNSSVGLDLMANNNNVDESDHGQFPPRIFCHSLAVPASVTPASLSCNEDNSCGTDDDDGDDQTDDGCVAVKPPTSASLRTVATVESLPAPNKDRVVKEVIVCHHQATVDEEIMTTNDQGHFRTGLVFEAGIDHYDRHNRLHKERPMRITSIRDALEKSSNNTLDRCCVLGDEDAFWGSSTKSTTLQVPPDSATQFLEDDDYLRVHLPGYMKRLDRLFDCSCCDEDRLDREAEQFQSIYFTKHSLKEARKAASSLCSLVENVVRGDLDNGFAVIRPPGHHAEPGLAGGYCIINNIAVAAAYARAKLGVEKILIVDWDVHHGNGTQTIFLKDPNVLYFSAHRWHGGNFFPFLSHGGPTSVGVGEGEGFNVNVGWTTKGMGDDEYLAVWECLLMPLANEFQPDLILVSAGFDAADGDLGECHITPDCYGRLTRSLMTLNTPIVCALEGGYVRSILGKCVCSVVTALLDHNSAKESTTEDNEDRRERGGANVLDTINTTAATNIRATIEAHKSYWSCLRS